METGEVVGTVRFLLTTDNTFFYLIQIILRSLQCCLLEIPPLPHSKPCLPTSDFVF
jgi:hypothetical protein